MASVHNRGSCSSTSDGEESIEKLFRKCKPYLRAYSQTSSINNGIDSDVNDNNESSLIDFDEKLIHTWENQSYSDYCEITSEDLSSAFQKMNQEASKNYEDTSRSIDGNKMSSETDPNNETGNGSKNKKRSCEQSSFSLDSNKSREDHNPDGKYSSILIDYQTNESDMSENDYESKKDLDELMESESSTEPPSPAKEPEIARVIGNVPIAKYEGSPRRYGPKPPGFPQRVTSNEKLSVDLYNFPKSVTKTLADISCDELVKSILKIPSPSNNNSPTSTDDSSKSPSGSVSLITQQSSCDKSKGRVPFRENKSMPPLESCAEYNSLKFKLSQMSNSGSSYIGKRLATHSNIAKTPSEDEKSTSSSSPVKNKTDPILSHTNELVLLHELVHQHRFHEVSSNDLRPVNSCAAAEPDMETEEQQNEPINVTLSSENTDCDSNELESEFSFDSSLHSGSKLSHMPILEDGLSSGVPSSDNEIDEENTTDSPLTLDFMRKQISEMENEIRAEEVKLELLFLRAKEKQSDMDPAREREKENIVQNGMRETKIETISKELAKQSYRYHQSQAKEKLVNCYEPKQCSESSQTKLSDLPLRQGKHKENLPKDNQQMRRSKSLQLSNQVNAETQNSGSNDSSDVALFPRIRKANKNVYNKEKSTSDDERSKRSDSRSEKPVEEDDIEPETVLFPRMKMTKRISSNNEASTSDDETLKTKEPKMKKNCDEGDADPDQETIWFPRVKKTGRGKSTTEDDASKAKDSKVIHEEDCDTDQETDRLLGAQRGDDKGFFDDKGSTVSKKNASREALIHHPEVLIEGVLFRARYLGSTQLVCEGQPTKATRMMQAEEAVSRIKAPEGETQPSTEVDLFISTEKIMVLNTDLKEIMMDHSLRTISYIADIGDLLVLMARRRMLNPNEDQDESKIKKTPKMICHVFESEEAQFIAQSIGQAFQVAYMEFLKANGIEDSSFVKEMDYQEVLNSQEIFGNELEMFAKKERQKEVIVPKQKGEILGMVIVESGWGSMLPTVVIANMAHQGPAARCGQLNIGDQIIAINGVSLVGLPLSTCQNYIKNTRAQTVVKLTVVPCAPVVEVKIKRPDTKYQLGFSVQNGVICSLLRGGIAERGGVRVGHRIIEINGQSVVAVPHERIVNLLATSVGEIHMKTMPTSMFRLLTGQESPAFI